MGALPGDGLETANLVLTDTRPADIGELEGVYLSWTDKEVMEGSGVEPGYFQKCMDGGELPPIQGASRSNFRQKAIRLKGQGTIIGFIDMYFGFPNQDTAWISNFVIDAAHRGRGYARETIEAMAAECGSGGFKSMGIGVYLKNTRALRFWTRAGFDRVIGVFGDADAPSDSFATIGLERVL